MLELRTCPHCGMRHDRAPDGVAFCACCLPDAWPIALGHAIARFVRRAEVAGLVETVERRLEHSPICDYVVTGNRACDCGLGRAADALTSLARLAGGES